MKRTSRFRCAAVVLGCLAATSCTKQEMVVTESPGVSKTTLKRANEGKPVISSTWVVDGTGATGQFKWEDACVSRSEGTTSRQEVTVTKSDKGKNIAWIVSGVALGAAATYLFTQAPNQSSSVDCTKDSSGQESCASDKGAYRAGGALAGLAGGASVVGGIYGLSLPEKTSESSAVTYNLPSSTIGETSANCGKLAWLKGHRVKLTVSNGTAFYGIIDTKGKVRIDLPEGLFIDPANPWTVAFYSVPKTDYGLSAGDSAGELDVSPYAAVAGSRQTAAYAEADNQDFTNVVHGDSVARREFTTECTPSGKDVCFDAIDSDCDGIYDVGCGYQSGALQWTLAWKTGDDLDLHVIGPDGIHVWFRNRMGGRAGLLLDKDCMGQFGGNCSSQNVENIFTPRDRKPIEGTYRGWVEVFHAVENESEAGRVVPAMLGGRIAGKAFRMPMSLQAQVGVRVHFAFAIGKDRDKDSVIDREDACPDEPGVYSPFRAEVGCPDGDLDGVADKLDACPAEAGIRVNDPKHNGCPRSFGHAKLTAHGVEIDAAIHFATASSAILSESIPVLKDVARVMREVPEALRKVSIEGHTDGEGDREKNYILSRDRARSVEAYLTKREKIPGDSLEPRWFGPDDPVADNDTAAGRSKNRRVKFRVVSPEPEVPSAW